MLKTAKEVVLRVKENVAISDGIEDTVGVSGEGTSPHQVLNTNRRFDQAFQIGLEIHASLEKFI